MGIEVDGELFTDHPAMPSTVWVRAFIRSKPTITCPSLQRSTSSLAIESTRER